VNDGGAPLPENYVTEPKDKDTGIKVTDPNVNNWRKFAGPVTGTKDNDKYWLDRLMQEELACKKQKADKKQAEARGLYIFSEAFSLEHCSIFKPAACVSNLCADGALILFLTTDSSKHRMKKYHFFRTLKLCPRPMTKAHPHRDCFYWTLF